MTAIVFVSGLAADPRWRVGGLTLLQRALIAAARAGVERCLVAGAVTHIAPDPRFPRVTPVLGLDDAMALLRAEGATASTRVVCFSADVVVVAPPRSLRRFLGGAGDAAIVVLDAVPVALVAFAALEAMWPALARQEEAGPARAGGASTVAEHGPDALFAWVRQPRQIAEVERQLLLQLDNPRDGRLDTAFNRKLSRPLSRLLMRLPLKPNHITVIAFLVALSAAFAFASGTYAASLLGVLLFQLAAVLDCCDGEVARVKYEDTRLGDVLDISLDAAANVALFLGIAHGAWIAGDLPDAALVAWGIGSGIAATFPLVTYAERALPEPAASREHRLVQKLVGSLTTRDFSLLVAIAAMTATLPWFLRGAAVGANVFWMLLLVLLSRGRTARQL